MKQRIVGSVDLGGYDTFVIPVFNGKAKVPEFLNEAGLVESAFEKQRKGSKEEKAKSINILLFGRLVNLVFIELGELPKKGKPNFLYRMSEAYAKCKEIGAEQILFHIKGEIPSLISDDDLRMIFEAGSLVDYCFDTYKTIKTTSTVKGIGYSGFGAKAEELLKEAECIGAGIKLARRLINEPAVDMPPAKLAEEAKKAGKENGFQVSVLQESEIKELGMNAFLAVGKGSVNRPVLIVMEYTGDPDSNEKLGVVGKGLCFDTGGYSIKSDTSMETMFGDMGGAAALIGAFTLISSLGLKINIVGAIPACENKISGEALLPGDIVKSMSGKYIEINNTDAEGRLTLVDGNTYLTQCHKVKGVIDIATLTGSVHTALGDKIAGVFTDSDKMRAAVKNASTKYGEKTWELPLDRELFESIESNFADIRNSVSGSTSGGYASAAALFIKELMEDVPWLHIDIGGVSWEDKGTAWCPVGGKGYGVKLLYGMAKELGESGL